MRAELIRRYSKQDGTWFELERLLRVLDRVPAGSRSERDPRCGTRFKLEHRLDPEMVARLVADYEAGVPTTQLTSRYSLGKSSVLRLLAEAGVVMRKRPMTPEQVDEAVALYEGGLAYRQVAERIELDRTTVWLALKARGVVFRSANEAGRRRKH